MAISASSGSEKASAVAYQTKKETDDRKNQSKKESK